MHNCQMKFMQIYANKSGQAFGQLFTDVNYRRNNKKINKTNTAEQN